MLKIKNITHTTAIGGFALPTVLVASIVMLVILLASVSAASSVRVALDEQYYTKLAQEAAEAGHARAEACLRANNYVAQWDDTPRLRPDTSCDGTTIAGSAYVAQYDNIRTSFLVWAPVTPSTGIVTVTVVGRTELIRSSNGSVHQTYSHTMVRQSGNEALYATASSSGSEETCGIVNQKTYCWGNGADGRLGNGDTTTSYVPVEVSRQSGVLAGKTDTDVTVGIAMACTISSGRAYCWGDNAFGKLGNNSTVDSSVPVPVDTTTGMSAQLREIHAGLHHVCALTVNYDVYCWGQNSAGELGNGTITAQNLTPVRVSTIGAWAGMPVANISTSIHARSTCASVEIAAGTNRAYCWGYNDSGQLGDGTTITRSSPVAVSVAGVMAGRFVLETSVAAANGAGTQGHACAVAQGMYCWGNGANGILGNGTTTQSLVPVTVSAGSTTGLIALGVNVGVIHACGLYRTSTFVYSVHCWGDNSYGQLGSNQTPAQLAFSTVPVAVYVATPGLQGRSITKLEGGGNRGCVIADQKTFCWGYNYIGQLGDGTTITRTIPTEATFLSQTVPILSY